MMILVVGLRIPLMNVSDVMLTLYIGLVSPKTASSCLLITVFVTAEMGQAFLFTLMHCMDWGDQTKRIKRPKVRKCKIHEKKKI